MTLDVKAGNTAAAQFDESMDDDFNTPLALASLFEMVTSANKMMQGKDDFTRYEIEDLLASKKRIVELGRILGLDLAKDLTRSDIDGAEVIRLPAVAGHVSLTALWQELGRRNVQRLLLEGGRTLAGAALREGLIDQVMMFVAPKLIGGASAYGVFAGEGCQQLANAIQLADLRYAQVGEDILITGDIERCLQV